MDHNHLDFSIELRRSASTRLRHDRQFVVVFCRFQVVQGCLNYLFTPHAQKTQRFYFWSSIDILENILRFFSGSILITHAQRVD